MFVCGVSHFSSTAEDRALMHKNVERSSLFPVFGFNSDYYKNRAQDPIVTVAYTLIDVPSVYFNII
jgi:hypothetical protein